MYETPNKVLIASDVKDTVDSVVPGDLVLIDADKGTPVAATGLATVKKLQIGVVKRAAVSTGALQDKRPAYIAKSKAFSKKEFVGVTTAAYAAPVQAKFTITFTDDHANKNKDPKAMVSVRVLNDVYGFGNHNAAEYVLKCGDYATADALAADFEKHINADKNSCVVAKATAKTLVLTGKDMVAVNPAIAAGNAPYEVVMCKVFSFVHADNSTVNPAVVQNAVASTGIGNPYVIRELEKVSHGYDGAMPSNLRIDARPASEVDLSKTYHQLTVRFNQEYRSADNHLRTTPVVAQAFIVAPAAKLDTIATAIAKWAGR